MLSLAIVNLLLFYTCIKACVLLALSLSFRSLLGVAWGFGQDPLALHVDVSLVTLEVEVTDSAGRPVNTLKKEDFQVYENGTLQDVRSFDSVETPYNILLLFDCSPSTEPDWPFLVEAMNRFRQMMRPRIAWSLRSLAADSKCFRNGSARRDRALMSMCSRAIQFAWEQTSMAH